MDTLSNYKDKALHLKEKYNRYIPAAFFALGFAFDLLTLGRIDSLLTISSQGAYLITLSALLCLFTLEHHQLISISERWKKPWRYSNEVMHFLFGALLSAYSLFYFMSASLATSLLFMFLLALLLLLNETPRLKNLGPSFKFALLTLCLVSYWSYFIPVLIGGVGYISMSLSLLCTGAYLALLIRWFKRKQMTPKTITKTIIAPSATVILSFIILFFLQAIPPVPLSIQYMGIYHSVVKLKDSNKYQLGYHRPLWKFWENGSQNFKAQKNQKIYCFARIFSPSAFDDKIIFHWRFKNPKYGWETMDKVPVRILGGRDQGFRAFVGKANHQPGQWRVQIETTTGREIGRISFNILHSDELVQPSLLDHY